MKVLGWICAIAFVVGLWSTPAQLPGESDLAYIMSECTNWLNMLSTVIWAFSFVWLLMFGSRDPT